MRLVRHSTVSQSGHDDLVPRRTSQSLSAWMLPVDCWRTSPDPTRLSRSGCARPLAPSRASIVPDCEFPTTLPSSLTTRCNGVIFCNPPLTVSQQLRRELGRVAARLLLSRVNRSPPAPVTEVLQPPADVSVRAAGQQLLRRAHTQLVGEQQGSQQRIVEHAQAFGHVGWATLDRTRHLARTPAAFTQQDLPGQRPPRAEASAR